jgi:hypothetical protein
VVAAVSESIFTYNYSPDATRVRGIYLPVELRVDERITQLVLRVDCASTYCVLERPWATYFGLHWEAGDAVWIGTATGGFQAFMHTIGLQIDQFRWETPVAIAEFESIAGAVTRDVLGLVGFFDRFRVTIDDPDEQITIEPRF